MEKENILFILHLPPPVHGSSVVGKQIFDSKKIKQEFNCFFVNLSTSRQVDKIGKFSAKKIITYFTILWRISKILLTKKIDKVYLAPTVSSVGFIKDFFVSILFFNKKKVYHLHNKGVSKRKKSNLSNVLYRSFFKNTKVILLSSKLYDDVKEFVQKKDVFICPNGIVDVVNLTEESISKKKYSTFKILFLSNLIKSKGVFVLLDACKMLADQGVNFTCSFVGGEGNISKEEFNNITSKLKLDKQVTYLGKKFGKEKEEIFLNSDVFTFPTHSDCFPLVILEAMMFGLPVISTYEGGIADIIINNKTGFTVAQQNATAIAEKLKVLYNDVALREQMGQSGRKKFDEYYTLGKFEKNLIDIIKAF